MTAKIARNESALVCAAQQGDRQAFQALMLRNWAWLKALTYGILGDPADVDDALQEVCVRVIGKIDTLNEPENFRPWLAVLARRLALRYRQQRARRRNLPVKYVAGQKIEENICPELEGVERKEQCQEIIRTVNALPEKYRQVFLLQHAEELTYAQIAEILDVPITTVQIRLVRARRMLYERLQGDRPIRCNKDESDTRNTGTTDRQISRR